MDTPMVNIKPEIVSLLIMSGIKYIVVKSEIIHPAQASY